MHNCVPCNIFPSFTIRMWYSQHQGLLWILSLLPSCSTRVFARERIDFVISCQHFLRKFHEATYNTVTRCLWSVTGYICNGDSEKAKLIYFKSTAHVICGAVVQNVRNLMDLRICNETQVSILRICGSNCHFLKVTILSEMSIKSKNYILTKSFEFVIWTNILRLRLW